jgi:hypothetical protein
VPVIRSTFSELLADQIAAYPHKDTYESASEDLKWTTQQMHWHVWGVTGNLHSYPSAKRLSYTVQASLRGEVLVALLAAPRAGKLFAAVPPFRKDHMMYVTPISLPSSTECNACGEVFFFSPFSFFFSFFRSSFFFWLSF